MNDIDERIRAYKTSMQNIETGQKESRSRVMQELEAIYKQRPGLTIAHEQDTRVLQAFSSRLPNLEKPQIMAQVDFSGDGRLYELDRQFISVFKLQDYIPTKQLAYPTVYCESLEEFFTPIVRQYSLSPAAKKELLAGYIADAQKKAAQGGIYGFNLPGVGCYLNGWLFAAPHGIPARKVLEIPDLLNRVLKTAVHEKLGHGFLDVYSSLGQVSSSLGTFRRRLAEEFGLKTVTDPVDRVRQEQANVLSANFILLQEGWATWIETFFAAHVFSSGDHPRHALEAIMGAVEAIPAESEEQKEMRQVIYTAIGMMIDDQVYPAADLMQAVNLIHAINQPLSAYFMEKLGQPLCYALGEMILMKAELNLGMRCVPFAALVAANITFDPEKISLSDMRELFERSADLNPDTRMVLISKIKLQEPGSVSELALQVENLLSLQVPANLKVR